MIRILLMIFVILSFGLVVAENEEPASEGQELSLKQDRAELDKLREEVPEDIKRENDDWAFILKLFDDPKRKPDRIKSQFNKVYNRTRKKKQAEFKKERKEFDRAEKKKRSTFNKDQKKKRKEFLAGDGSKDAKKEFFDDERTARKDFYSDQKTRRKDFESDMKAKRKEFDDFMKDRRKEFDDRFRQFKKDQKERKAMEKKMRKARKKAQLGTGNQTQVSPENQGYLDDFSKIPKKGGHRLAPKEEQ